MLRKLRLRQKNGFLIKKSFIRDEVTPQNFVWSQKEASMKYFGIGRVDIVLGFRFILEAIISFWLLPYRKTSPSTYPCIAFLKIVGWKEHILTTLTGKSDGYETVDISGY